MVRARARDPYCPSPVVGLQSAEGARVPGQERQQLRPRGRPTTSMGLLTNLTAATNGAKTDNFKETSFLLVLAILNNDYPQTRKGAGHRAGLKIGRAIDDHVLQAATARVLQHLRAQYDEDHAKCREVAPSPPDDRRPAVRALRVESSTLSSFIEETFFQRCCGDWNQVTPSERHDLNDRFFYGTSVNLDEAYRFLKTLGLFPDSGRGRNQDSGTHYFCRRGVRSPEALSDRFFPIWRPKPQGASGKATFTPYHQVYMEMDIHPRVYLSRDSKRSLMHSAQLLATIAAFGGAFRCQPMAFSNARHWLGGLGDRGGRC